MDPKLLKVVGGSGLTTMFTPVPVHITHDNAAYEVLLIHFF